MANRYGLEIRAADGADAPGLAELLQEAGQTISPHDIVDRLDRIRVSRGTALIAVEWGPPSGLVLLHWYQGLAAARPNALITALLVAPAARRRGIGRLLVKAASQAARAAGCEALALANTTASLELADFCAATGFSAAGGLLARNLRKKSEAEAS